MSCPSSALEERTTDITTTGRRSAQPQRIEIAFYRFADSIYLSGIPGPRPAGVVAEPCRRAALRLSPQAAPRRRPPAMATVIADPAERRRILSQFTEEFNQRRGPDSHWPKGPRNPQTEGPGVPRRRALESPDGMPVRR